MRNAQTALALGSLALVALSGVGGVLGTWIAVEATSYDLGLEECGEFALVTAPSAFATLGAAVALALGLVALFSRGSGGAARAIGGLGAVVSLAVVVLAGGFGLFVAGLAAITSLAWH